MSENKNSNSSGETGRTENNEKKKRTAAKGYSIKIHRNKANYEIWVNGKRVYLGTKRNVNLISEREIKSLYDQNFRKK